MAKFIVKIDVCNEHITAEMEKEITAKARKSGEEYVKSNFNDVEEVSVEVEFKNIYRSEISSFGYVEDGEYTEEGLTAEEKEAMLDAVLG